MGSGLVSPGHLALVLLIALLVFGPRRLPELGRSLGGGMRSFKDAITGGEDEEPPALEAAPVEPTPAPADHQAAAPTDAPRL